MELSVCDHLLWASYPGGSPSYRLHPLRGSLGPPTLGATRTGRCSNPWRQDPTLIQLCKQAFFCLSEHGEYLESQIGPGFGSLILHFQFYAINFNCFQSIILG